MKHIFIILAFLITATSFAQFKIQGEIKGYENKPVHIKVYEDGNLRLLKRVKTDNTGLFDYSFPMKYIGVINFELSNAAFDVVSNNQDISFSTNLEDPQAAFTYQGGINKMLQEYQATIFKEELRDNTLTPLLQFYQKEDKFYQDLSAEINRINQTQRPRIQNQAIQYYIDTKEEINLLSSATTGSIETAEKAKVHLVNDDENLEQFGFLTPMLSIYISNALGAAKNKEEASHKIEQAIDDLLADAVAETPRGQHILSNVIMMLSGNGFKELATQYIDQANAMTCSKSGDLKQLLATQENIQVGKVAPNFAIDKSEYESLYDVQADKKLIIFWASWCPHCVREMPYVQEFYTEFKAEGGEIIAVSLDMDEKQYNNAIQAFPWINHTDLLKWDSPIVQMYGVSATPTMILLDQNNKILQIGSRISEFYTDK